MSSLNPFGKKGETKILRSRIFLNKREIKFKREEVDILHQLEQ